MERDGETVKRKKTLLCQATDRWSRRQDLGEVSHHRIEQKGEHVNLGVQLSIPG